MITTVQIQFKNLKEVHRALQKLEHTYFRPDISSSRSDEIRRLLNLIGESDKLTFTLTESQAEEFKREMAEEYYRSPVTPEDYEEEYPLQEVASDITE